MLEYRVTGTNFRRPSCGCDVRRYLAGSTHVFLHDHVALREPQGIGVVSGTGACIPVLWMRNILDVPHQPDIRRTPRDGHQRIHVRGKHEVSYENSANAALL
jgi:hypothetical protein